MGGTDRAHRQQEAVSSKLEHRGRREARISTGNRQKRGSKANKVCKQRGRQGSRTLDT